MTVRELINKLLDEPMDNQVLLCDDTEHIDEFGEKCNGYSFDIDDVKYSRIMFTDWRDTKTNEVNVTPLPDNHGRLIDADSLIKAIEAKAKRLNNADTINGLCGAVALIFDAPTIIAGTESEKQDNESKEKEV